MYAKQLQHVVKPTVSIRLFTKQSALLLGIKKNVQIWLCNTIDVPQVKGYLQPIILLPLSIISNLNSKQIEAIVLHELAHVKRNDYLLYIFQLIAKAILLFNPFALLLNKAINKHREYCCDDLVLHFNYNNKEYATALYILEANRQQVISVALAATNTKSGLFNRIKRIIEPSNLQQKNTPVLAYSLLIVCCLSCILLYKPVIFTDKKITYNLHSSTNYISENTVNKKVAARLTFIPKPIFIKHNSIVNTIGNSVTIATHNGSKPLPQIGIVNKEWIAAKQKEMADLARQVAEKTALEDADEMSMVNLVKIEEEQSGSNNKILYYFEVNNIGGKPVITPIYLATKPTKNIKQKKKTQVEEIAY
jgi:beta-lactamase regulating signal transducer with metallopeptidase domain